jgi:hypothetical protein
MAPQMKHYFEGGGNDNTSNRHNCQRDERQAVYYAVTAAE